MYGRWCRNTSNDLGLFSAINKNTLKQNNRPCLKKENFRNQKCKLKINVFLLNKDSLQQPIQLKITSKMTVCLTKNDFRNQNKDKFKVKVI